MGGLDGVRKCGARRFRVPLEDESPAVGRRVLEGESPAEVRRVLGVRRVRLRVLRHRRLDAGPLVRGELPEKSYRACREETRPGGPRTFWEPRFL